MILRAAALVLALALPAGAATVAAEAEQAAADLTAAVAALQEAETSRQGVAALTRTIAAYEKGLAAMREALRAARLREATLALEFEAKSEEIARLLAVLMKMEADPAPLLLLHPAGPLGTARSGMILSDITPSLQAEAEALKAQLQELATLRAVQEAAGGTLTAGLQAAQDARTALSQAISDRAPLPKGLTEDPAALAALLESAATLDAFAGGLRLSGAEGAIVDFPQARGKLPLPVAGTLLRGPGEADAAGIRRPGLTLATAPRALVTSPWGATIRYRGPLLDYGNVIILEPGSGYLMVLAGLGTVYGEVGDVIAAGDPLGLMTGLDMAGQAADTAEFLVSGTDGTGVRDTETLYLELRQGADPVDPTEWFAATAATGD